MSDLFRGHCPACGWHGRRSASEDVAVQASARHALRTGHAAPLFHIQTAKGPKPAPWDWH